MHSKIYFLTFSNGSHSYWSNNYSNNSILMFICANLYHFAPVWKEARLMSVRKGLVNLAFSLICLSCFFYMAIDQIRRYLSHPTKFNLYREFRQELEFPAISFCDHHYRFKKLVEKMQLPRSPIAPPSIVRVTPLTAYRSINYDRWLDFQTMESISTRAYIWLYLCRN